MLKRVAVLTFALLAVVCSFGCGGAKQEAAAAPEPQVDPRFATSDALLQYYNSIATREPVDAESLFQLFYAETDPQRRLLNFLRQSMSLMRLDRAMFEKFGEGWDPHSKKQMITAQKPATMVKREPQRAQATFTGQKGNTETIYLVQFDNRWWVSGYTLEYDPDISQTMKDSAMLEKLISHLAAVAPKYTAKVAAGEFKSAMAVRAAVMMDIMANNPELAGDLAGLAEGKK